MTYAHFAPADIVALRDGTRIGLGPGEEAHLEVCDACRAALERARERAAAIARALSALDEDFDLETARAAVRWRVARATTERRDAVVRAAGPARHLARAAGVLLVLAGAAAALPGSPVRSWLTGTADAPAAQPENTAATEPSSSRAQATQRALVRVAGGDGVVVVTLEGVAPGSVVEVRWVGGSSLGVFAPTGSSFSSAFGRIDATVAPGDVRVELPLSAAESSVSVAGQRLVHRSAGGTEVTGPVEERGEDVIRFRIPAR